MLEILQDITRFGFWVIAFVAFGLPVIVFVLSMFGAGFQEGGLFSWKGRMNRISFVINYAITFALAMIAAFIAGYGFGEHSKILISISFLLIAVIIFRALSLMARRIHDIGLPGVLCLIWMAFNILFTQYQIGDLIGIFIFIVVALYPGSDSANKYGDKPKSGFTFM